MPWAKIMKILIFFTFWAALTMPIGIFIGKLIKSAPGGLYDEDDGLQAGDTAQLAPGLVVAPAPPV